MRYLLSTWSIGFFLMFTSVSENAIAQSDFFSSSPGKLSTSHVNLDGQSNCETCHTSGKSLSRAKCLGCHDHEGLKKRISANKGFHSSQRAKGRACEQCHKEHRGRSFNLMGWQALGGISKFDHREAGWALQAKHKVLACKECHEKRNRQGLRVFISKSKTCGDCHQDKQPHGKVRVALRSCERCHSQASWAPPLRTMRFDHNKKSNASMPLVGTHLDVACSKCHPMAKFKLSKKDANCAGCHQSPHDGQLFGTLECKSCHSPKLRSLRLVQFSHRKQTHFPLLGKHGKIACARCHTQRLRRRKPAKTCVGCHASQTPHKERFSAFNAPGTSVPDCATCHQPASWNTGLIFDHNKNTKFPLTGKHQTIRCRQCHRGKDVSQLERFSIKEIGCLGCHQHKEAHGGKYTNNECLTCHTDAGEKRMTKNSLEIFHGAKAKFPLTLQHAKIRCERCHVGDIYESTPMECGERCHEDSLHMGRLGNQCSSCHSPGRWDPIKFSHEKNTDFPLLGRHKTVPTCRGCHPTSRFRGTPRTCGARGCHKKDDIHEGGLGDQCQRCHNEKGENGFVHNRQSSFKLDGAHTLVLCASCHTSRRFTPTPKTCVGCHDEPAVHKGLYGTTCESCHTTSSFGDIEKAHDVGDFALRGAHDSLACNRCHKSGEKRRGSGNLCITCHKADDVHQNGLSPRCGECHKQTAFLPARFSHLSIGCNLPGLHRTLPCSDCHKNGNFVALSPLCVSCHRDTAMQVDDPPHGDLIECGGCHNTNTWFPASELGREGLCR